MCRITKGKYYKAIHSNIIVKATTSSYNGNLFKAILIEDKDGEYRLKLNLNQECSGWNPDAFKLLKDYPNPKTKSESALFPIY